MIHTYQQATLLLIAIAFTLAYWMTRRGPLALIIRALLHLQAFLLGVRLEAMEAARRVWSGHHARLAAVQNELER